MIKPAIIRFNSYNTRRNLPPKTGRKRGESNFLGAFERYLRATVFTTGFGGKHFSLSNYGVADFIWLLPPTNNRDGGYGASLFAFETKLENWRRAFQQAYRYSYYSDAAFVVLPPEKSKCAKTNLDLFQQHGIGLWLFDKQKGYIERIHTPSTNTARNIDARKKAIAAISAKVKLSKFFK
jgi:hypothetical protein